MIYLLEDDEDIRDLLVYTLNAQNLETLAFGQPSEFWRQMETSLPDLILLDIMLPEESGLSILEKLRNSLKTKDIPVLLLTAKDSELDIVKGLDLGADDYITKPFRIMELISRVKANLRRVASQDKLSFRELNLYPESHRVEFKGRKLDLTLKEYELLYTFLKHPHRAFTREQLLEKIWGYDYMGETRTVDVHIGSLRQKLDDNTYIKTIRGIGYKLGE